MFFGGDKYPKHGIFNGGSVYFSGIVELFNYFSFKNYSKSSNDVLVVKDNETYLLLDNSEYNHIKFSYSYRNGF